MSIKFGRYVFGDPLPSLFKLSLFIKKHDRRGGGGERGGKGLIYSCIENLKNLPARNHRTSVIHQNVPFL